MRVKLFQIHINGEIWFHCVIPTTRDDTGIVYGYADLILWPVYVHLKENISKPISRKVEWPGCGSFLYLPFFAITFPQTGTYIPGLFYNERSPAEYLIHISDRPGSQPLHNPCIFLNVAGASLLP